MAYTVSKRPVDSSYDVLMVKPWSVEAAPDRFPSSVSLQSKSKFFGRHTKYIVTVIQELGSTGSICFRLWAGYDHLQGKAAFESIHATLTPLLSKGTVLLTKPLLKEVILPSPMDPGHITSHLIDVMDLQPDSHPEWLDVIQALLDKSSIPSLDASSRKKYIADLKATFSSEKKSIGALNNVLGNVPFIAVPNALESTEDIEESDQIWQSFKQGTLDRKPKQEKDMWLIRAVEKKRHRSCMNLILSRVNPNDQCPSTGDTALHVAVRNCDLFLVKLLLAYKADPTIANQVGETPIDAAKKLTSSSDSRSIQAALEQLSKLQMQAKSYFSQNDALPKKQNSSDVFLLSLDGGGMRSVIMCHILAAIESRMKELCSSCDPLHSYFDYTAGTSAGAIIAGFLQYRTTISVSNAGMYLYKFMNEVFCCDKSSRSKELKEFLINEVGENTVMSDVARENSNVIITATIANTSPSKLHLMTNYGKSRDDLPGPDERKVWEALVASSAAPTYFPAYDCFLDGGLMANNPTLAAMADIFEQAKEDGKRVKLGFVLSLGTGYLHPAKDVDDFEVYVPGFSFDVMVKLVQSSMGLVSLLNHFIEESTQSNGEVVREARAWCSSIDATYLRFSPPLKEDIAPDMNCIYELVDLLYATELYILQEHVNIDKAAKIILSK